MASSEINEKIAQAIDTLIEKRVNNRLYDKTEVGKIYSIVDSQKGIYKVIINSNLYTAYDNIKNENYKKNEEVYIKVPQADYNLKLFIESKVNIDTQEEEVFDFIEASPIFDFKPSDKELGTEFGLIAGEPFLQDEISKTSITLWNLEDQKIITTPLDKDMEDFKLEFIKLMNENEYLQIQADFKTTLIDEHYQGEYGILCRFNTNDGRIVYKKLSNDDFIGQLYSYDIDFFTQFKRINLKKWLSEEFEENKDFNFYLEDISFFQSGFKPDVDINSSDKEKENREEENIFVKNIKLTFLNPITEEENNAEYRIKLVAENGYVGDRDIRISAKLLDKNNKDITDETAYVFYWFKEFLPYEINDSGYTDYDYNAYDSIQPKAATNTYNLWEINQFDIEAVNEKGEKLIDLYSNEIKEVNKNKNFSAEELNKQLKEIAEKYGYAKNKFYLQNNKDNKRRYRVVVYKENYDKNKNPKPIASTDFWLYSKSEFQDTDAIPVTINAEWNTIEKKEKDENNEEIINTYISGIKFSFELPENYFGFWELDFEQNNGEELKKETVNGYNKYGPNFKTFQEKNRYEYLFQLKNSILSTDIEELRKQKIIYNYKVYITSSEIVPDKIQYNPKAGSSLWYNEVRINALRPLGFKEEKNNEYYLLEEDFSEEEKITTASLFSLREIPDTYISDSTYILKEESGEYLTLKDYILSYLS